MNSRPRRRFEARRLSAINTDLGTTLHWIAKITQVANDQVLTERRREAGGQIKLTTHGGCFLEWAED